MVSLIFVGKNLGKISGQASRQRFGQASGQMAGQISHPRLQVSQPGLQVSCWLFVCFARDSGAIEVCSPPPHGALPIGFARALRGALRRLCAGLCA